MTQNNMLLPVFNLFTARFLPWIASDLLSHILGVLGQQTFHVSNALRHCAGCIDTLIQDYLPRITKHC